MRCEGVGPGLEVENAAFPAKVLARGLEYLTGVAWALAIWLGDALDVAVRVGGLDFCKERLAACFTDAEVIVSSVQVPPPLCAAVQVYQLVLRCIARCLYLVNTCAGPEVARRWVEGAPSAEVITHELTGYSQAGVQAPRSLAVQASIAPCRCRYRALRVFKEGDEAGCRV